MKNIPPLSKYLFAIVLIIFIGLPTITVGGSFVSSLIQGKTAEEAVVIIAEQLDKLFGRVDVLEEKQMETDESIIQAQLEIERLRLENENLRLRAEEQEKAIGLTNQCEKLERPIICLQNEIKHLENKLFSTDLSSSTSLQEVVVALGGDPPWRGRSEEDTICLIGSDAVEWGCRSRIDRISEINTDRANAREQASQVLESRKNNYQELKLEFDSLSCQEVLDKYVPDRKKPGCG